MAEKGTEDGRIKPTAFERYTWAGEE